MSHPPHINVRSINSHADGDAENENNNNRCWSDGEEVYISLLYTSAAAHYLLLSFSGPSVILRHTNARTIIILMAILRLVSLADIFLPASVCVALNARAQMSERIWAHFWI